MERLPESYYTRFLSDSAKERQPSPSACFFFFVVYFRPGLTLPVRSLFPLEATPGLISLLAGKPNGSMFPFTSFSFTARSPVDPSQETTARIDGEDLAESLQYGATAGYEKLVEWLYGLQAKSHGRAKGEGWRISVGSGSQDLIYKVGSCYISMPSAMTRSIARLFDYRPLLRLSTLVIRFWSSRRYTRESPTDTR